MRPSRTGQTVPAFVRVRPGASGVADLNVADLLATGEPHLVRLSEADRPDSDVLKKTVGDDDGWLSSGEVINAHGLHADVVNGYRAIGDHATNAAGKGLDRIAVRDVVRLMRANTSAPDAGRLAPARGSRAARVIDPILTAASAVCDPRALQLHEQRLARSIAPDGATTVATRGFSLRGYGGPELIRYLRGDWRSIIASHTFTASLRTALEQGQPFEAALLGTAERIADDIATDIEARGYKDWARTQSRATQIGIPDKKAVGMAAYFDAPHDAANMTPTSFSFARSGYHSVVHEAVVAPEHPMIMLEVRQPFRAGGYGMGEYYIPSHVPPTQIEAFSLGFSSWFNVLAHEGTPPKSLEQWFRFTVDERDASGAALTFTITPIVDSVSPDMQETWRAAGPSWSTKGKSTAQLRAFGAQFPSLAPTLAEISVHQR
jgi:hypothetical protein